MKTRKRRKAKKRGPAGEEEKQSKTSRRGPEDNQEYFCEM
jgi:hypothetical protein